MSGWGVEPSAQEYHVDKPTPEKLHDIARYIEGVSLFLSLSGDPEAKGQVGRGGALADDLHAWAEQLAAGVATWETK